MADSQAWALIRQFLRSDLKVNRIVSRQYLLRYILPVASVLFGLVPLLSQGTLTDTSLIRGRKALASPGDSIPTLNFTTPGTVYHEQGWIHDTLGKDSHEYDPARLTAYPYATLGNLGSPARPLYFNIAQPKGINTGHRAFDLYKVRFEDFRFYDTDIGLTRLAYSQGIDQQDAIFRAQFGRNFDRGVNFSLNYQRINQTGQFASQRAKDTGFGIGVLYRSPKGKLDGIYHYQSNSIIHQDNGGVDLIALDTLDLSINAPVTLTDALTTHRARQLSVQHHFHLFAQAGGDTTRRANVDLIHTLQIGSDFVKFSDATLPVAEAEYYAPFVTDDRGMRNFVGLDILDNRVDVQFRYHDNGSGIPSQILRGGIQFRRIKVNQEPLKDKVQELFVNFAGQLGISKSIALDGDGYIGLVDATENYRLQANARLKLFKDARTSASLVLYQRKPDLTEQRFFVNQIAVWQNNLRNVNLSSLHFNYDHPSLRLRLHGALHTLSNMIYYDSLRLPQQLGLSVELLQLSASKEINLGPLGVFGHIMLQHYDAEEVALPRLILQGQLFYTGRWFKKRLLVRTGLDFLMTDTHPGVSYFPVTGQFYYDPAFSISQYPAVDVFFSMQVKEIFRAFLKMENVTSLVSENHFVQVAGYPHFVRYFRFGLWMKLAD